MRNLYCLSGLGADERIFRNLSIEGMNLVHLPWVAFDKHDDLPCYAQKMAEQIPEEEPTILGLSFGGMITIEIMKQMPVRQAFLVSSAKRRQELPDVSKSLKFLIKNELVPYSLFTRSNSILFNRFGAETEDEKKLLGAIVHDTEPAFLQWAFKAILNWQNTTTFKNVMHIHGTADRILRPEKIKADHWIKDGTHMMVYNRAAEISSLIEKHI